MSKRQFIEERRKKNKRQQSLMQFLMIGGVLVVVGAVLIAVISSSQVNLSQRNIIQPEIDLSIQSSWNGLGDPNAPVIIEDYSDYGCSHCADFALITKHLIEEQYIKSGQVYFVFHSVGGLLGSPATLQAAEGSYCAAEQDNFWPFHDLLFANQVKLFQNRSADVSRTLEQFAEILELDLDQFNSCLSERKYKDLAADDEAGARQNGITGTPSFVINGVLFQGNQPFENFQQVIEDELAKAAK